MLAESVAHLSARLGKAPPLAVWVGSGFGLPPASWSEGEPLRFEQVPHFPQPATPGHPGLLIRAVCSNQPFLWVSGRVHLYEGRTVSDVVYPVRVLASWGVGTFLFVSAAGGIAPAIQPGTFMVVRDHLNWTGQSPLAGPEGTVLGDRFVDMSAVYDATLAEKLCLAGRAIGRELPVGVYAAVAGPQYETPAEVRMLGLLGADAVGMSTVPEVIALRQMRRRVAFLCGVTNRAAQAGGPRLTHEEVLRAASRLREDLVRLLAAWIPLVSDPGGGAGPVP
ncbi:MAG: purine-nucleoside phosphorylase [Acidobacteriota bacterium]